MIVHHKLIKFFRELKIHPFFPFLGRWTREEHQLFLKGLELYGKGWKKIASHIKTRTVVQTRTHAQKYFLKQKKQRQFRADVTAGNFFSGGSLLGKKRKNRPNDKKRCGPSHIKHFFGDLSAFPYHDNMTDQYIVDGLYNFLSPPLDESCKKIEDDSVASKGQDAYSILSDSTEFFRSGHGVNKLLDEAEGLDWLVDSGCAATINNYVKLPSRISANSVAHVNFT